MCVCVLYTYIYIYKGGCLKTSPEPSMTYIDILMACCCLIHLFIQIFWTPSGRPWLSIWFPSSASQWFDSRPLELWHLKVQTSQIYNVLISFDRTGCQRETIRTSHSRKKWYISFPLLWMIHICRGCNWIHYGKEQMDNFPRQRCKSACLLRPFRVYPQSTWRSCWNPSTTKGDCAWFDPPDGRAMGTHGMPGPMWCRDLAQEHLGSALLHPEGTVEVLLWQLSWHVMVKKKCLSHCFGLEPMWVWVNTYRYIFSGMNIHKSQLFWCELQGYQGFDPSPCVKLCETLHQFMFLWKVWLEIGGLLLSFPGLSGSEKWELMWKRWRETDPK